jgi:molybdenum cofactor cytidylyltransferase
VVTHQRSIFAVILAAGRGKRFGATKQLAEIDGQAMVRRSCRLARAVCGDNTLLVAGVRPLAQTAGGILLLLADQPLITEAHLRDLLACWKGGESEIVATSFAGTLGPPVLFPPGSFPTLTKLSGDRGARSLLHDTRFDVKTVAFEDAAVDIDTQDQLETVRTMVGRRLPGPGD